MELCGDLWRWTRAVLRWLPVFDPGRCWGGFPAERCTGFPALCTDAGPFFVRG